MIFVDRTHFTFLFILIKAVTLFAQDSYDIQFNFAKKLYDEEKFFDAITEFKRLLFFDETKSYNYEANFFIGLSYKGGAKFSDAVQHFTLAELNSRTEVELYESRLEIIKVNILRRTTQRALVLLDSLENDARFNKNLEEINYWRGWAYIFSDDWEKASLSFADINSELEVFCNLVNNDFYNVTLAKTLSIIPGAGQFYTGEYVSGLISIGWNVLWGFLTIDAFIDDRVFDGVMIGTLLWWRFYSGNIQNAEKFALEKNLAKTNSALRFLQQSYNGKKP